MHMAADMSRRLGWVDQELVDRSVALMKKAGLPVELPKGGGMDMDKFLNVRGGFKWLICGDSDGRRWAEFKRKTGMHV